MPPDPHDPLTALLAEMAREIKAGRWTHVQWEALLTRGEAIVGDAEEDQDFLEAIYNEEPPAD